MSLCIIDGKQCQCYPADGEFCKAAEELKQDTLRYRRILEAYIDWVGDCEGIDYLSNTSAKRLNLTDKEYELLLSIARPDEQP